MFNALDAARKTVHTSRSEIVALLQHDPRALLDQAFDLTAQQRERLDALSDAVMQQTAHVAVATLRAEAPLVFRMARARPPLRPGHEAVPPLGPGNVAMLALSVPIPGIPVGHGVKVGGSLDVDLHGNVSGGKITISGGDC